MLANGATLGYAITSGATSYTDLPGLKEVPDLGPDAEKVDNTCLTDSYKQYDMGIGDLGDMTYKFKWDNSSTTSPYRVMRGYAESKTTLYFKETMIDGTAFEYAAQVSVKRLGGAVNGVIDVELSMAVQSDFTYTDPS